MRLKAVAILNKGVEVNKVLLFVTCSHANKELPTLAEEEGT